VKMGAIHSSGYKWNFTFVGSDKGCVVSMKGQKGNSIQQVQFYSIIFRDNCTVSPYGTHNYFSLPMV
jgi:hypothetical protein